MIPLVLSILNKHVRKPTLYYYNMHTIMTIYRQQQQYNNNLRGKFRNIYVSMYGSSITNNIFETYDIDH